MREPSQQPGPDPSAPTCRTAQQYIHGSALAIPPILFRLPGFSLTRIAGGILGDRAAAGKAGMCRDGNEGKPGDGNWANFGEPGK